MITVSAAKIMICNKQKKMCSDFKQKISCKKKESMHVSHTTVITSILSYELPILCTIFKVSLACKKVRKNSLQNYIRFMHRLVNTITSLVTFVAAYRIVDSNPKLYAMCTIRFGHEFFMLKSPTIIYLNSGYKCMVIFKRTPPVFRII